MARSAGLGTPRGATFRSSGRGIVADNQVKGFIVENKTTPGFSVEKIEHKIALKVVQNGQITLKDVRVPEANRLQGGNSFRDTARVLRMTRYMVGWASTGVQMGAFEATLKYAQERLQFGKPIASFQMVQDLLAKMLANVTACQCLMVRLAQMHRRRQARRRITRRLRRRSARPSPRDRRLGAGVVGRQRHRRRLQRRALLRGRRSALLLRRHVSDAEPDRRQGHHRPRRLRVTRAGCARSGSPSDRNEHGFATATLTFARSSAHHFANGSTDARKCPLREKDAHRLCDASTGPRCSTP